MTRIYLPRHQIERLEIMRRLRELNVFIPGWEQLDTRHLRDILQKEEELAGRPKPPKPERKMPKDQIVLGLKEFLAFQRSREAGRRLF